MRWTLVIALVGGCVFSKSEGEVYMLRIPYSPGSACGLELTENHQDGAPPQGGGGGGSDWTETESGDYSDQVIFVEVVDTEDGGSVLLVDGAAYVGTTTKGVSTFVWETFADGESVQEHTSGYTFTQTEEGSVGVTVTLTPDKDVVSGTWAVVQDTTRRWEESDEWDADEVGASTGQTPFGTYLLLDDSMPARNRSDVDDCGSDTCRLELSTVCDASSPFTGVRVKIDDEAYLPVAGAGQDGGWQTP